VQQCKKKVVASGKDKPPPKQEKNDNIYKMCCFLGYSAVQPVYGAAFRRNVALRAHWLLASLICVSANGGETFFGNVDSYTATRRYAPDGDSSHKYSCENTKS
jgi:hypothetical protein